MRALRKELLASAIAIVVFTIVLGLAYPLFITGVSQVAFKNKAQGSQVTLNGRVIGSRLIAQDFQRPVIGRNGRPEVDRDGNPVLTPDVKYFQSRPSQSGYNPSATAFSNAGPNGADTNAAIRANAKAYLTLERRYDPSLTLSQVPPDAVQTSASGVDPDITLDNAHIQAHRIADVRGLSADQVNQLINDNTNGRGLGLFGEKTVNVLDLNLALDKETSQ
ncbi:MAG TPA: potassium-transporting ATPase subunit C [Conexibacter sp.]|jgi:K+-transporting ATPase ATPase C chain